MSEKVILELRDDCIFDKNGMSVLCGVKSFNYEFFDMQEESALVDSKVTIELVKLGVSVDEIIKLKNMDLI